jgi:hypothetical protein
MNLAIRGIDTQIAHADSFHNDRTPTSRPIAVCLWFLARNKNPGLSISIPSAPRPKAATPACPGLLPIRSWATFALPPSRPQIPEALR